MLFCKCVFVQPIPKILSSQWDCCCHPVVPNREFRSCFLPQTPATLRGWKSPSSPRCPREAPPTLLRGGLLCWRTQRCFCVYCDCTVKFHIHVLSFQCFYPPSGLLLMYDRSVLYCFRWLQSELQRGKIREEISWCLCRIKDEILKNTRFHLLLKSSSHYSLKYYS